MTTFAGLKSGYEHLWETMKIRPEREAAITNIARKLLANKDRYQKVSDKTGVPWDVIAVLHNRESDANFSTYLGNGEPLSRRTRLVPKGRGPFHTWEEGAIDAIKYDGLDKVTDWTPARTLFEIEKFNGFGYRNHGINSPYLWSWSNQYDRGKYVADGKYSSSAVDQQVGAIPLLKEIRELDGSAAVIPGTPASPDARPILKQGDRGMAVEVLQRLLPRPLSADGIFGPMTKASVLAFQRANGLEPDGIAGPATWAKLLDNQRQTQ